jgi:hypothetical protein
LKLELKELLSQLKELAISGKLNSLAVTL